MSKAFSEKMEQEYYEERFLQEAAKLVDSNLLGENSMPPNRLM